jgi:putative DNA primase/helicase
LPRLVFPYKFVRPGTKKKGPNDRPGDPKLRDRVESDPEVAQAALAFAVEGAVRWYRSGRVMPQMPASVKRDTDNWRAESDLVFRYWSECLVADSDAHVLTGDLSEHFNEWLKEHGHREWSSKTIAARFGDHDVTQQAKVEKPRPMKPRPGLSRPASITGAGGDGERVKPKQTYRAWNGVRFADEA